MFFFLCCTWFLDVAWRPVRPRWFHTQRDGKWDDQREVTLSCWTESKEGLAAPQADPSRGLLTHPPATEEHLQPKMVSPKISLKHPQREVTCPSTNSLGSSSPLCLWPWLHPVIMFCVQPQISLTLKQMSWNHRRASSSLWLLWCVCACVCVGRWVNETNNNVNWDQL